MADEQSTPKHDATITESADVDILREATAASSRGARLVVAILFVPVPESDGLFTMQTLCEGDDAHVLRALEMAVESYRDAMAGVHTPTERLM